MDPGRCGLDGHSLQEVGLRGDVVCQSGQPLTAPCPSQALRMVLCPLGLILKGPWLVEREPRRAGLLEEGGGLGLTCSKILWPYRDWLHEADY